MQPASAAGVAQSCYVDRPEVAYTPTVSDQRWQLQAALKQG
jgi:hypothetical protein